MAPSCLLAQVAACAGLRELVGADYGIQTNTRQLLFGTQMSTGQRLREERERLGLNQVAFAELGGVKKVAQINYEKDERAPDSDYLAGIAQAGVDVLYVITGMRAGEGPQDAGETVLLDSYRRCSVQARGNLVQTAALLAAGVEAGVGEPSKRPHVSVGNLKNDAAGAVQIGYAGGRVTVKKGRKD